MFPLYDTVRSRKFPFINFLLIAVNVLVFLYEVQLTPAALQAFIFEWGVIPADVVRDPAAAWQTVFASMFLHGGWFHIINNMWVLFIFGDNVEAGMGSVRYLVFYLLSGVAAVVLQTYTLPSSTVPMIGASGAISGALGAYLVLFPRARVLLGIPAGFLVIAIGRFPAKWVLLSWFVLQFFLGLLAAMKSGDESTGGIAFGAHIGGFVAGALLVAIFKRRGVPLWRPH